MSDAKKCEPPADIRDTWIGRRVLEHEQRFQEEERRHERIDAEITSIKGSLTDVNFKLNHILQAQDNEARVASLDRASSLDVQRQILDHMKAEDKQRKKWYSDEDERRKYSKKRYEFARWIFVALAVTAVLLFMHLINRWN